MFFDEARTLLLLHMSVQHQIFHSTLKTAAAASGILTWGFTCCSSQ